MVRKSPPAVRRARASLAAEAAQWVLGQGGTPPTEEESDSSEEESDSSEEESDSSEEDPPPEQEAALEAAPGRM